MATFEELLEAIRNVGRSVKGRSLSISETYKLIGSKTSLSEMEFDSQEELEQFLSENPYDNI